MIRLETNEKMDLDQNTISHCIVSNETQITLHYFQGRISAIPEIRADLFLAISRNGMCLLFLSLSNSFTFLVPSWSMFKKVNFSTLFKVR